jgi:hypothetical protein
MKLLVWMQTPLKYLNTFWWGFEVRLMIVADNRHKPV